MDTKDTKNEGRKPTAEEVEKLLGIAATPRNP